MDLMNIVSDSDTRILRVSDRDLATPWITLEVLLGNENGEWTRKAIRLTVHELAAIVSLAGLP